MIPMFSAIFVRCTVSFCRLPLSLDISYFELIYHRYLSFLHGVIYVRWVIALAALAALGWVALYRDEALAYEYMINPTWLLSWV